MRPRARRAGAVRQSGGSVINQNLRCNEQIRISPVRLIDDQNNQMGVLPTFEALKLAREAGLDLVEVAPMDRPPVCRIMDYGKWKYAQKKKKQKHHEQQLKEVRLRPKTDTHDRDVKIKHAVEFLQDGDKVQFTMKFRGRERSHREIGYETFRDILDFFGPTVKIERPPSMEGRDMVMIVSPIKGVIDKVVAPLTRKVDPGRKPAPDAPAPAAEESEPSDRGPATAAAPGAATSGTTATA